MTDKQPLLLIVGMHRSGTSLLGSILTNSGISMPGQLIPGDIHNQSGYFERTDVTAIQEELLIALERWWPSPRGAVNLPPDWVEHDQSKHALQKLTVLLGQAAQHQSSPWAIKDPRSSILLPLWHKACQANSIPLRVILAVRNPAEVVASLIIRDKEVTGMDGWRAQNLWRYHNQQVLLNVRECYLDVVCYERWFNRKTARKQLIMLLPDLTESQIIRALKQINPQYRRSEAYASDNLLRHDVLQMYQKFQEIAFATGKDKKAKLESLRNWVSKQPVLVQLAPEPRRRVIKRWLLNRKDQHNQPWILEHPWAYLAQLVAGSDIPTVVHLLRFWEEYGFRDDELTRFANLPGAVPPAEPWSSVTGKIQTNTGNLRNWGTHAWIQHCPVLRRELSLVSKGSKDADPVFLNLNPVRSGPEGGRELLALYEMERVWDPDYQRVRLLRQFGIKASWLKPDCPKNKYLASEQQHVKLWGAELGLPSPTSLKDIGKHICLGSSSSELDLQLQPPLLGISGFDKLFVETAERARLLASWLQECLNEGLELVRFQPSENETAIHAWEGLWQSPNTGRAPILLPRAPMEAVEILEQLSWYREGCPMAPTCITPEPVCNVVLERRLSESKVSVCISLFNYADKVLDALESVRNQKEITGIELIIVDDTSEDHGVALVETWMKQHSHLFSRCLLLRHEQNSGLAAARNSAFSAAESPWCYVLDADNAIDPLALANTCKVAKNVDAKCAVVHSLIRVVAEDSDDTRHLVSTVPWQQERLRHGNDIDAMALIRRSAWEAVGGYTHIPGGWEDYDFWCCLIEAGWHGVLCPQVLATYTSHRGSMRSHTTNQTYRLSQLLQQRHPWLDIPQGGNQTASVGHRFKRGGQAS